MYCRACSREVAQQSVFCPACGANPMLGTAFCFNCGQPSNPSAVVCLRCGVPFSQGSVPYGQAQPKSKIAAGLLSIFLGWLGIGRFYLGFTGLGLLQLLLSVLSIGILIIPVCIWTLIEGILMLTGSFNKDAKGNLLQ